MGSHNCMYTCIYIAFTRINCPNMIYTTHAASSLIGKEFCVVLKKKLFSFTNQTGCHG